MYINSGYLNNSRTDFKDNSTPLVVGSCGTYRLKTRPNLPTYWQKIGVENEVVLVGNGDMIEIWTPERWEASQNMLDSDTIEIGRASCRERV